MVCSEKSHGIPEYYKDVQLVPCGEARDHHGRQEAVAQQENRARLKMSTREPLLPL